MTASLGSFLEAWELFRAPAIAGALAGALLGMLGVYVVLRRMVFLSAALSQSAGLGVTLAFYVQLHLGVAGVLGSPTVWATAATLAASFALLALDRAGFGAGRDSLLGLVYLVGAAGAIAMGTRIVQEVQDVHAILFGSAVVVLEDDLVLIAVMAAVLLALHLWWWRGFLQASFDSVGARVRGLPVALLEVVLLVSIALSISISTRILGALPVFAFSVLPALAAVRVAANVHRALVYATAIGALSGFGGYVLAYVHALPVGASQALLAALFVVAAEAVRSARRLGSSLRSRRGRAPSA